MKLAITGGSGQLGTQLLRRCVGARWIERVTVLDRVPPAIPSPKIAFIQSDVRDPDIGRHFDGIDAVVHLAFLIFQQRRREEFDSVNVAGRQNVFEAAAAAAVGHLLYASSIAAYGVVPGHPVPVVESTTRRYDPQLAYSANKFEVEAFLDRFEQMYPELVVTRFRPSVLLGRRMPHMLGRFLTRGLVPTVFDAPVPLVWDGDVADAFMLALKKRVGGAFLLSADAPLTVRELAREAGLRVVPIPAAVGAGAAALGRLTQRLGLGGPIDPNWLRKRDVVILPSSERAKTELGWRPRRKTAADVVRYMRRRATGATDRRLALFMRIAQVMSRLSPAINEARHVDLTIHLDLWGPGGGDFTIEVKDGRTTLQPGAPRPLDALLSLRAADFLRMLSGELDQSTADLTGKIQLHGEPIAKMVLGGLVTLFRKRVAKPGLSGLAARRFSDWIRDSAREGP